MKIETPFAWLTRNAISNPNGKAILSNDGVLTWFDLHRFTLQLSSKLDSYNFPRNHTLFAYVPETLILPFALAAFRQGFAIAFVNKEIALECSGDDVVVITTSHVDGIQSTQIVIDNDWLESVYRIDNYVSQQFYDSKDSPALIAFTSGTTGKSKGAVFTIENLVKRCTYRAKEEYNGSAPLSLYGLGAMVGLSRALQNIFNQDATVVFDKTKGIQGVVDMFTRLSPKALRGSPAQVQEFLTEINKRGGSLASLQRIYIAGAKFQPSLHKLIKEATSAIIHINLGGTEYGGMARKDSNMENFENPSYMGQILKTSQVKILDESGDEASDGEVGRIATRTPVLISNYFKNPIETERSFLGGWFLPGDLGYKDGMGGLYLVGRSTELVNFGGVKINLAEIDTKILDFAGIQDSCAFEIKGKLGFSELGLAVVLNNQGRASRNEVEMRIQNEFLRKTSVNIFFVDSIPRSDMGKPLRSLLSNHYSNLND